MKNKKANPVLEHRIKRNITEYWQSQGKPIPKFRFDEDGFIKSDMINGMPQN